VTAAEPGVLARLVALAAPTRVPAVAIAVALGVLIDRGWVLVPMVAALGLGAVPGVAVAGALTGAALRFGTPDLAAVAGDQSVLGPAVLNGDAASIGATATAAAAILAVAISTGGAISSGGAMSARNEPMGWHPLAVVAPAALGTASASLLAGPDWGARPIIRLGSLLIGLSVAVLGHEALLRRPALRTRVRVAGLVAGIVAATAGMAARPDGSPVAVLTYVSEVGDAAVASLAAVAAGLVVAAGAIALHVADLARTPSDPHPTEPSAAS